MAAAHVQNNLVRDCLKHIEVDFILTCHDRESYAVYARRIIESYRWIKPNIILAYNGKDDGFACDVRIDSIPGLHRGDHSLIRAGYGLCRHLRIVKLSVDTWLLDEKVLISAFDALERKKAVYAGNYWGGGESLSTDVIVADLRYGNVFENLTLSEEHPSVALENSLYRRVRFLKNRIVEIAERSPVFPNYRYECRPMMLTAHHALERNLENVESWSPKLFAAIV